MPHLTADSRSVHSNQLRVHPRLPSLLERHLRSAWKKPAQAVDRPALRQLSLALTRHDGPLILDSFCGTGRSTAILAARYPQALVIGVDKSAHRLHKHAGDGDYLLLHAHCEAVWQALVAAKRPLAAHYMLYPNPWPKAAQLARRVHGHPAFPLLLALGGTLCVRSNWQLYLEELGVALHLAGRPARIAVVGDSGEALTLFERKYRASGQTLWQLDASLKRPGA